MTVAANDKLGGPGGSARGGAAEKGASGAGGKNPWRRLWQVPLLAGGVLLFGLGVRAFIAIIRPVPFEEQAQGVRSLLMAEQFGKAIDQINVLGAYYTEARQQAVLQGLAGDAHYLAEKKQETGGGGFAKENWQRVADHYTRAVTLGAGSSVVMNERWGEAALALGDTRTAIEKWEAVMKSGVEAGGSLVEAHAREMVTAYVAGGELAKAQNILDRLLALNAGEGAESVDNQSWAVCKQIEIALIGSGKGGGVETLGAVVEAARKAVEHMPERDPSGRIMMWIGRAELEKGEIEQARKDLTDARRRFMGHHLDDGRAAVLLAKIAEAKGELDKARELYDEVVQGQAGTGLWAAARLGRAEMIVRVTHDRIENVLADYHYAITAVREKQPAELVDAELVHSALVADFQRASDAGRLQEALTFLALQQELGPTSTAATGAGAALTAADEEAMAFRLATTKERRGEELLGEALALKVGPERSEKEAAARALLADAAADYLRHSKLTTMQDAISGNSLWKAAGLLDRAGRALASAEVYQQFTIQRPRDARVPEALLAIGRAYQSAGQVEKAIPVYQRNVRENPKTPAAYASAVEVARCFMMLADTLEEPAARPAASAPATMAGAPATMAASGPAKLTRAQAVERAEASLLSLVQQNSDLLPTSNEFRVSLLTLGELYYRDKRWADAILRLEEAVARYPADAGVPRTLFLLAESYRNSAMDIGAALGDAALSGREALEAARLERLLTAANDFSHVIARLDPESAGETNAGKQLNPLEEEILRSSYMDRAACHMERGGTADLAAAIKLFDDIATRFPEEEIAVRAYVQVVNAYGALKQPTQASAAAERGLWVLKRVPGAALAPKPGRAGYEKLLTLGRR